MTDLQQKCNEILDNETILEEDKVDHLEELVRKKYASSSPSQIEKIIMGIMWKHKDPSKIVKSRPCIAKIEHFTSKVDIPSLERKLQLESEFLQLEALKDKGCQSKQFKRNLTQEPEKSLKNKYNDQLQKPENEDTAITSSNVSPIDKISDWFGGEVSKVRVEQALKSAGYNVVDAAELIIKQLKNKEKSALEVFKQEDIFNSESKKKVICSFFMKNGKCLRTDCQFSHDVNSRICRYWLKGYCSAGEFCLFNHSLEGSSLSTTHLTATALTTTSYESMDLDSISPFTPSPIVSRVKLTRQLKKPEYVPWENTLSNKLFPKYVQHRDLAFKYECQRRKYAQMSTESWKSNNGGKSKQLSQKANEFEDKYFEELKRSDEILYEYSEENEHNEVWFELHGYEFADVVEEVLKSLKDVVDKESKYSKTIYLVVPSITQYDYKKTTKPLIIWLDHEGYRYQILSCGTTQYGFVIILDPWSIL